jgi:hypothetical protein
MVPSHFEYISFTREAEPELRHSFGTWPSGITGVKFEVPDPNLMHHEFIIRAMSGVFGAAPWTAVRGPIRWS